MSEREPERETIRQGELFFLFHPNTTNIFSGYGLTVQHGRKDLLTGLLMVDRPRPVNPSWLAEVSAIFGEYHLIPMTATGERGIVCRMQIESGSIPYLRQFSTEKAGAIKDALQPLLEDLPNPIFRLRWEEKVRAWQSQFSPLP